MIDVITQQRVPRVAREVNDEYMYNVLRTKHKNFGGYDKEQGGAPKSEAWGTILNLAIQAFNVDMPLMLIKACSPPH